MHDQLSQYINSFLTPYLCGYRKGFSTQKALLSLIEKWKIVLDSKGHGGAVLMDLSKAFNTINHDLLIAKLHAYGFSKESLKLIKSYLTLSRRRPLSYRNQSIDLRCGVSQWTGFYMITASILQGLTNRWQRTRVNLSFSSWSELIL